ncbi:hypothetical protein [Chromatium okenii]|uniref:hypothetical protein n=1 Tax=Chromatium okenii TaxID=61644 RepID=UPI001558A382|nr:hypothetical protein [Chromatium okenii]
MSEQRFRIVFDHAPLGIAIPDAKRVLFTSITLTPNCWGVSVRRCWDNVLTA